MTHQVSYAYLVSKCGGLIYSSAWPGFLSSIASFAAQESREERPVRKGRATELPVDPSAGDMRRACLTASQAQVMRPDARVIEDRFSCTIKPIPAKFKNERIVCKTQSAFRILLYHDDCGPR